MPACSPECRAALALTRDSGCIAESNYSDPGNKRARLFTAAGSASETRAALRIGRARAYFKPEESCAALELLDRILRILFSLSRR
jgi:hypothetical protein